MNEDMQDIVEIEVGPMVQVFNKRLLAKIAELSDLSSHNCACDEISTVAFRGSSENLAVATSIVQNILDNTVELILDTAMPPEVYQVVSNSLIHVVSTEHEECF